VRARIQVTATPAALVPWPATNYRRWTNFSWHVVEQGGQPRAGAWTASDAARLNAIVNRAHEQGLWVRFYTLNGHGAGANRGWTDSYNFGSAAAVIERWQAAIAAGVDFVATDQYEDFARVLAAGPPAAVGGH
jgi:glycerophosphoryl diester phosphodiesterase